MTELTDLSDTDASNTSVSGEGISGATFMTSTDNVFQAILGMLSRFRNDGVFQLRNSSDNTKKLSVSLSALTTATTRTLTIPDESARLALAPHLAGHIDGLTLSNNSTDPTNDIDIATGVAIDSTNAHVITLSSGLTKRLDAAWAVGTNQGGLDTGAIGNNTYFVFLIKRPDTGVVDVLFSLNTGTPNLPTNYTLFRRIGSIIRTGGAITGFVQDGDIFMRKVPINDISSTNPGTSAVSNSLSVPVGLRVEAILSVGIATSTTSTDFALLVTDLSTTDTAPSVSLADVAFTSLATAGTYRAFASKRVFTNTGAQVRSRISTSDASTAVRITTHGWIDRRGRT